MNTNTNNALISNFPLSLIPIKTIGLNLSFKVFWIVVFLAIFSLLIACVFQLNAYTKEIYLIKSYQNKIIQLTQENKILEIDFAKANSLNNIGNYAQNGIFEKTNKTEYIRVLEDTVLAR